MICYSAFLIVSELWPLPSAFFPLKKKLLYACTTSPWLIEGLFFLSGQKKGYLTHFSLTLGLSKVYFLDVFHLSFVQNSEREGFCNFCHVLECLFVAKWMSNFITKIRFQMVVLFCMKQWMLSWAWFFLFIFDPNHLRSVFLANMMFVSWALHLYLL